MPHLLLSSCPWVGVSSVEMQEKKSMTVFFSSVEQGEGRELPNKAGITSRSEF